MGLISRVSSRTYRKFLYSNGTRENKKGRMNCKPKQKQLQSNHQLQQALKKSINRKNELTALGEAKTKGSNFHLLGKNGEEKEMEKGQNLLVKKDSQLKK